MKPGNCRQARNKKMRPNKKETRNWLALPYDVMIHIFLKLGVIDLLLTAQHVCSSWRSVAKDPRLYRYIDMRNAEDHFDIWRSESVTKMTLNAIDRSCGQLVEFSMSHVGEAYVLEDIAEKCTSLKCLRLSLCSRLTEGVLIETLERLPALEEFVSHHCSFTKRVIKALARFCPQLKSLEFTHQGIHCFYTPHVPNDFNGEAFAIAANLPHLRRLHLFGNSMDKWGLQAILDKCIHLEYLDIRQCFGIKLHDLEDKCKGIMNCRFINDSTEDCEFDTTFKYGGFFSDESDFSVESGSGYSTFDDDEDDFSFP